MEKKTPLVILRLALKDLKHEWILTVCLIMAIAAVLSPLLLLFGLKYGIIDWGTDHLRENPRYREIRPMVSKSFNKEWFGELEARNDVDFIMPMTRQIASGVKANIKGHDKSESLNIVPTMTGDPLLLENGAVIPGDKECVITEFGAETLGAKVGETLVIKAGRIVKGKFEYGELELTVKAILPPRASQLKSIYVKLPILEAVERFKDGQAVPEYGWAGSIPRAYPLHNGIVIVLPEKLSKFQEMSLCTSTGFTQIELLEDDSMPEKVGFGIRTGMVAYRLYTLKKPAGMESVKSVQNKMRGKNASLFLWNAPFSATLLTEDKKEIGTIAGYGLTADSKKLEATGINIRPPWQQDKGTTREIMQIMLPPELQGEGDGYFLRLNHDGRTLEFPVTATKETSSMEGVAYVPEKLAGILRLFQERNIQFDGKTDEFTLFRRGYAGFRLYADTIYDVNPLRIHFDSMGIPVNTEILAINQLIQLDKGMTVIFWLLAAVGIIGSVASLVASLYASVERKKREISVLRLIGLSSFTLFRFPVYQGMVFGAGGFLISMLFFSVVSEMINNKFGPYAEKLLGYPMGDGVSFCWMPPTYVAAALAFTIFISALAAMVAAFRVTSIEPAEALRDE